MLKTKVDLVHGPAPRRRNKKVNVPFQNNISNNVQQKVVYVSNIPYDVNWKPLKNFLREKIGDVRSVDMIEKDGKSQGRA